MTEFGTSLECPELQRVIRAVTSTHDRDTMAPLLELLAAAENVNTDMAIPPGAGFAIALAVGVATLREACETNPYNSKLKSGTLMDLCIGYMNVFLHPQGYEIVRWDAENQTNA